ncbi:TRAP transporter large permease subunit [Xanthobacteraceae bacterium Astr-EGSB]|uniref:TRAP transporter large permease n=1 Tax=Astrobacterium formosum TaxID=3069710 RepID=UPI0027B3B387|nr:TRAP transporter large permease subunit [Xanthobacteraceae bacterium Astr-EGSB]
MNSVVSGVAGQPGRLARIETAFAKTIEAIAACLVFVELVVLSASVVSRYGFHRPLYWADELAATLFLWLGMLGAVTALQRREHMRLKTIVQLLPPNLRDLANTVNLLLVTIFAGMLIVPALEYVEAQIDFLSPALDIPDSYRVSAVLLGFSLLVLLALARLFTEHSRIHLAIAVVVVLCVFGGIWLLRPVLTAMGNYNLLVFFVLLISVFVFVGLPIAFAFGIPTLFYLMAMTPVPISVIVTQMEHGMSSLLLLAIPMFVFLGYMIEMTGVAAVLVRFLFILVGHIRGGLACVLLGAMYLISGVSGSKAADMAAIAPALLPEMERRGSDRAEMAALMAAAAGMSDTIPPSLFLITLGSVAGVSIAALFTGGLLPAAVAAVALLVLAIIRDNSHKPGAEARAAYTVMAKEFVIALPALILPFVIRGAVVEGVATATEVSTIGVVYSLVVGIVIYRRFDWRRFYPVLVETASMSGAILIIIGTATAMSWALAQAGFAHDLVTTITGLPGGIATFLALSVVLFAVLGSVLEGVPAIVLFGPLMFPVARALGIHDVHYAMVVILAMSIGLFAPPFGIGFYIACAMARVEPDQAVIKVWRYLFVLLLCVILIAAVPWISLCFL